MVGWYGKGATCQVLACFIEWEIEKLSHRALIFHVGAIFVAFEHNTQALFAGCQVGKNHDTKLLQQRFRRFDLFVGQAIEVAHDQAIGVCVFDTATTKSERSLIAKDRQQFLGSVGSIFVARCFEGCDTFANLCDMWVGNYLSVGCFAALASRLSNTLCVTKHE